MKRFLFIGFRWSHEGILLLIEEYRQREQEMKSGKITPKRHGSKLLKR